MSARLLCVVLTDKQEMEVPASPRQVNGDLSRTTSRQQPVELPSAASTPSKRSLRKTASALSPRKNTGKRLPLFAYPVRFLCVKQVTSAQCGDVWFRMLELWAGWQVAALHMK